MTTRVLRVKLSQPLKDKMEADGLSPRDLVTKLGISRATLDSMLNDDWRHIRRSAIEKAADYVDLRAEQIFEFVPVDFWGPIEQTRECLFLRGSSNVEKPMELAISDHRATDRITEYLVHEVPGFKPLTYTNVTDENELIELARNQTCIVIGSPKSNLACEILVSRLFGAKAFDSSEVNRQKIPFGFCWPADTKQMNENIVEQSSLACSESAFGEMKGHYGIAMAKLRLPVDYKSREEYLKWETKTGKDCGLVLVANDPFGGNKNVKLIVLAGYSGIGTVAAAAALVRNFRVLEPQPEDKCVYGIVEAKYSKKANSDSRRYSEFFWRYRHGGLLPGVWPSNKKAPN